MTDKPTCCYRACKEPATRHSPTGSVGLRYCAEHYAKILEWVEDEIEPERYCRKCDSTGLERKWDSYNDRWTLTDCPACQ